MGILLTLYLEPYYQHLLLPLLLLLLLLLLSLYFLYCCYCSHAHHHHHQHHLELLLLLLLAADQKTEKWPPPIPKLSAPLAPKYHARGTDPRRWNAASLLKPEH
jgi:hypothetical protein